MKVNTASYNVAEIDADEVAASPRGVSSVYLQ